MKKISMTLFAVLLSVFSAVNLSAQEVLKPKIVQKLQQNVFEVVVEKIEEDPLSYEKELPLDRIPYHIRMDKYDSIGTAFLLKDGHFYTAAHVLSLYHQSQMGKFFIRTAEGKTYKIGNILRFASDRDFIVFDVIDFDEPSAKGLETDTKYQKNSSVFAVGNAQGEGIVMRNGLLTSETPENRNGAWNWLRFSAAASPGNSGGPLVTPQGKVIGIVAMKNSSENLNYALPIAEVNSIPENKGEVHIESYYNLPNILTERFYHTCDFDLDLPKTIEETQDFCIKEYTEDTLKLTEDITQAYKYNGKESFTKKDSGNPLLNSKFSPAFPLLICLNDKAKWGSYSPKDVSNLKLENNGKIEIGSMLGIIFSYLKKPDDVSIQKYIEDPKLLMDTLSKAFVMTRQIGSEKITITSYGEPVHQSTHKDTFGRQWIITAFNVPFADYVVYNYSLPLPDGIFSFTAMRDTATVWNGFVYDFKFLSDFILSGYYGTIDQWNEYLSIPEDLYPRHKVLEDAVVDASDDGTHFKFSKLDITCPKDIYEITDKTDLRLSVGLRPDEENGLKLEVQSLTTETLQTTNDNSLVLYSIDYKPDEDSPKNIRDSYDQVSAGTIPYNGKPYEQEQKTAIFVPTVTDEYIKLFGLVYKGSKMETIEKDAERIQGTIK